MQENPQEVVSILKLANMAAPPQGKQDEAFFKMLALEVTKDFGKMPITLLDEAINNGIKGYYSDGKNVSVTSISIYNWIHERVDEYKEAKAKAQMEQEYQERLAKKKF